MIDSTKKGLLSATFALVAVWVVMIASTLFPSITQWGIVPRELSISSFLGIILSPFIHGSFSHIIANSIPLFVLIVVLTATYRRLAVRVILWSVILGGSLVWSFARGGTVIGASGLIFALMGFLISNVIFRKDIKSFAIALLIFIIYGGCLMGIFPNDSHISWEGHLFGLISGVYLAYAYRKEPSR